MSLLVLLLCDGIGCVLHVGVNDAHWYGFYGCVYIGQLHMVSVVDVYRRLVLFTRCDPCRMLSFLSALSAHTL